MFSSAVSFLSTKLLESVTCVCVCVCILAISSIRKEANISLRFKIAKYQSSVFMWRYILHTHIHTQRSDWRECQDTHITVKYLQQFTGRCGVLRYFMSSLAKKYHVDVIEHSDMLPPRKFSISRGQIYWIGTRNLIYSVASIT